MSLGKEACVTDGLGRERDVLLSAAELLISLFLVHGAVDAVVRNAE